LKIFTVLFTCFLVTALGAQTVVIPVAKTVSSIPILALEGQTVGGLILKTPLFDDHPLALAELLGGRSQVLLTGSTLAIRNSQSGGPLVQVATTVWDVSGLVTLDPGLKTFEDFVGKTIVVPLAGGPLDTQLQVLLRARGLQGRIKIDYAEPVQAVALLLQKRVEGACLPEPLVSRVVLMNQGREVFTFAEAWAPLNGGDGRAPQVSLVARRDWAGTHQEFLKALVKACRQSVEALRADPTSFAVRFAPILELPVPVVERGLRQTLFEVPKASDTLLLYKRFLELTGEAKPLAPDFIFPQ
jgi:NitT/TauT family transport system substrate-binding protein